MWTPVFPGCPVLRLRECGVEAGEKALNLSVPFCEGNGLNVLKLWSITGLIESKPIPDWKHDRDVCLYPLLSVHLRLKDFNWIAIAISPPLKSRVSWPPRAASERDYADSFQSSNLLKDLTSIYLSPFGNSIGYFRATNPRRFAHTKFSIVTGSVQSDSPCLNI